MHVSREEPINIWEVEGPNNENCMLGDACGHLGVASFILPLILAPGVPSGIKERIPLQAENKVKGQLKQSRLGN